MYFINEHDTDFLLKFLYQLSYNHRSHTLWFHFRYFSLFAINLRRWKRSKIHKNEASLYSIDLNVTTSFISFFVVKIMMLNFGSARNTYVIDVTVIYASIRVVCSSHESHSLYGKSFVLKSGVKSLPNKEWQYFTIIQYNLQLTDTLKGGQL